MQSTALGSLATPGMAQLGLFFEVISDIRELDRPGTNDAAFRSGVRLAIAERLPPLPGDLDWPPVRLAPGSTAADAAGMIARTLLANAGPATALFARIAGSPVAITATRTVHRALTPAETDAFDVRNGARACEREGVMTAGALTVARTRLVLIPERLPAAAWGAIQAGGVAGTVLGPYGMRRTGRKVKMNRQAALVDASATLVLGDQVLGTAEEHVTEELCRHAVLLDR